MIAVIRWAPSVPGILLAVASATALVAAVGWQDNVPVIGKVPSGIPIPSLSDVAAGDVLDLLGAGASVALLVFASSMLTASALTRRDRELVSGRREFLGLAAASVGSWLLQGFPANTSDSRSFMVADARARSQLANLVAAALTAVTVLVLTPVFGYLGEAAFGAVVLVASARDGRRRRPPQAVAGASQRLHARGRHRVRRSGRRRAAGHRRGCGGVAARGAAAGGAAADRGAGPARGPTTWRSAANHDDARTVPGLLLYRFDAPLFFANAAVLREEVIRLVDASDPPTREVVIDAEGMIDMNVTGARHSTS